MRVLRVRLPPLERHPEVRRQLRRIDILRNRREHVAALALQQDWLYAFLRGPITIRPFNREYESASIES